MTCTGCEAKVKSLLSAVPGVTNVSIDLQQGEGEIEMSTHVAASTFEKALAPYPKYKIEEIHHHQQPIDVPLEEQQSWYRTYKPVILLFGYITAITLIIEFTFGGFDAMRWMSHFMAGFFLTFCFFKLLDLRGFAESYAMYDIIAMKWPVWGYIYATLELALGLAYLTGFEPLITNSATFTLMSVSVIGVIRSVMNKRKIKCACLGAVFNLPMSTITIIEDVIMIAMSASMILMLL